MFDTKKILISLKNKKILKQGLSFKNQNGYSIRIKPKGWEISND